MTEKLKCRAAMIATADGRWAILGNWSIKDEDTDWSWIDEMCDHENPTVSPQRYWVEVIIDKPMIRTVTAANVIMTENETVG